jgi:hypothetical protein
MNTQYVSHNRAVILSVQISPGANISEAACDMVELATWLRRPIDFDFNDVPLTARPRDVPDDIVDDYFRKLPTSPR